MGHGVGAGRSMGRKDEEIDNSALLDLTKPHVDSFDYFVERGLEAAIRHLQPIELKHPVSGTTLRNILLKVVPCLAEYRHFAVCERTQSGRVWGLAFATLNLEHEIAPLKIPFSTTVSNNYQDDIGPCFD
jgi:hypothetical protein